MNYPFYFDPKNTSNLFGLKENFDFLSKLYSNNKLPKVLMLSGNRGVGKSTLINHFLFSVFDSKNYDNVRYRLINASPFLNQFKNNFFSNIIYISGSDFKSVKIDDIRNLKTKISKTSILNKDRFVVLDDVEIFNKNSLNALLKLIEEPTNNSYFILINNKSVPLLETIKSRALEVKVILSENQRLEIIDNLISFFKLELKLEPKNSQLSPGNFLKFNYLCNEYDISLENDFIDNLSLLLSLYKKNKDILFIIFAYFIAEYHFNNLISNNSLNKEKIFEIKSYVFESLNNFLLYNLNQSVLINAISKKLNHE